MSEHPRWIGDGFFPERGWCGPSGKFTVEIVVHAKQRSVRVSRGHNAPSTMEEITMQLLKAALVLTIVSCIPIVAWSMRTSGPLQTPGPQNMCTPATALPNPDATCAKAITGCVCTTDGSATIIQLGYCLGCDFSVSGTYSCTSPHGGGPINCDVELECNGEALCGTICPCTDAPYYPFMLSCGSCDA
jgi:hypothetical protein